MEDHFAELAQILDVQEIPTFKEILTKIVENTAKNTLKPLKKRIKTMKSEFETRFSVLMSQSETCQKSLTSLQKDLKDLFVSQAKDQKRLQSHHSALTETSKKLQQAIESVNSLQESIPQITTDLAEKANIREIERIKEKMTSFCPILYAEKVELGLKSKAELEFVKKLEEEIEALKENLKENYCKIQYFVEFKRKLEEENEKSAKGYVKSNYFNRVLGEIQNSNKALIAKNHEISTFCSSNLTHFSSILSNFSSEIASKASISDLSALETSLSSFITISVFENYSKNIENACLFIEDNRMEIIKIVKKQEEALQRFDEILLEKANKMDLMELEKTVLKVNFGENLMKKVGNVEEKCEFLKGKCENFEEIERDLEEKIEEIQTILYSNKSEKREFQQFSSALNDLTEQMSTKLDKSDYFFTSLTSTLQSDISTLMQTVSSLYRLDKLSLTLLYHCVTCLHEVTAETVPESMAAAEWLQRHAEMVVAWISVYTPVEREVELPQEIGELIGLKPGKKTGHRGTPSPLGMYSRRKSQASPVPQHTPKNSKRLVGRRGESMRRNAGILPSLESTFDNL